MSKYWKTVGVGQSLLVYVTDGDDCGWDLTWVDPGGHTQVAGFDAFIQNSVYDLSREVRYCRLPDTTVLVYKDLQKDPIGEIRVKNNRIVYMSEIE